MTYWPTPGFASSSERFATPPLRSEPNVYTTPRAGDSPIAVPQRSLEKQRESDVRHALVGQLYDRVRKLACSLCKTDVEADDLTQQALLELLRAASTFNEESSLDRWVERVTVHCAQGVMRKEMHRKRLLERWLIPGSTPWGAENKVSARDPIDLDDALEKLPAERRQVMIMRHGYGYTVDEISEMLETPRGTVKDRLVAAKKQLRRAMRAELADRGWLEERPPSMPRSAGDEDLDASATTPARVSAALPNLSRLAS